jgi:hypothetical protein
MQVLDQRIGFWYRKPGNFDVELGVHADEVLKLLRENLLVPGSIQCQLVVGEHVGPFLRGRHVFDPQARDAAQPKKFRSGYAAVPGQYAVVRVDQHWIDKTELIDPAGELPDLFRRMDPRVPAPRLQVADVDALDCRGRCAPCAISISLCCLCP